jgi:hypothetical protein
MQITQTNKKTGREGGGDPKTETKQTRYDLATLLEITKIQNMYAPMSKIRWSHCSNQINEM